MNDSDAVHIHCTAQQEAGEEIADGTARVIASWWHGGQSSAAYSFVSTGAVDDATDLWREMFDGYHAMSPRDRLAGDMLGTYLMRAGRRGPVAGWSDLWVGDDVEVSA